MLGQLNVFDLYLVTGAIETYAWEEVAHEGYTAANMGVTRNLWILFSIILAVSGMLLLLIKTCLL